MIAFPKLHRESTLELPVVGALSAIACGLLLPVSWKLGAVALMPCGLWVLYSTWLGFLNGRLRYVWSRQYSRRVNRRQLRALLETDPERFTVHLRFYGGLDVVSLCPAAVVEDSVTGELSAIYPASWSVPQICEKLGVRVIQDR